MQDSGPLLQEQHRISSGSARHRQPPPMGDLGIVAGTSRTRSAKALKPSKSVQRSVGRAVGV